MKGYGISTQGDRYADVYDELYGDVSDTDGTVEAVTALAGGGRVLELGVGTGRLAIPLARRGLEVHGIDASAAMVGRLRAKGGGDLVHVTVGDFAAVDVPGPFAVVFAAYNTFFNLTGDGEQARCLTNAAARLAPGGVVVLELFVPDDEPRDRSGVQPSRIEADRVVLAVWERDHERRLARGQNVVLTEAGVRLLPWEIRYASADEVDALAAQAGLRLRHRWGGWRGEPFDDDADRHVSIYERS